MLPGKVIVYFQASQEGGIPPELLAKIDSWHPGMGESPTLIEKSLLYDMISD